MADEHAYVNGKVFPVHKGAHKLQTPFVYDGKDYKTQEEFWLANLLTMQGVPFFYERINFPGWVPDFVFRNPYRWHGQPYPGSRIWGIELKWLSPLRPEWIKRSIVLWQEHRIPILVLSRADLEPYFTNGHLPIERIS